MVDEEYKAWLKTVHTSTQEVFPDATPEATGMFALAYVLKTGGKNLALTTSDLAYALRRIADTAESWWRSQTRR